MTAWKDITVAWDRTHHLRDGRTLYTVRFDEVLSFHDPGLAAVQKAEVAWHITPDGNAAYSYRFLRTFGFYESRAAVVSADGAHHIHPDGTDLYPDRYTWCGNYQVGRCPVREKAGGYKHVKLDGTDAYATRWRYAGDFREGAAAVMNEEGLSSHIDPDGVLVHGRWFLDADVFHKGVSRARDARGWMHIDRAGYPIYGARFVMIEPFYNDQARVLLHDGSHALIARDGNVTLEFQAPG